MAKDGDSIRDALSAFIRKRGAAKKPESPEDRTQWEPPVPAPQERPSVPAAPPDHSPTVARDGAFTEDDSRKGRGRPPNPATIALRERLRKDSEAGQLQDPSAYIDEYADVSGSSPATARQTVYRELQRLRGFPAVITDASTKPPEPQLEEESLPPEPATLVVDEQAPEAPPAPIEAVLGPPGPVVEGITSYHAKFFAHEITRLAPGGDLDRISQSLFDACVDLQPHQIEAGLFALKSPLSKGVLLADEVGLGKTIEAGLVLCQFWAERKRKLLIVVPASIRKQWQLELTQKFSLPSTVLERKEYEAMRRQGHANPFLQERIVIVSYHFASRLKEQVEAVPWDLVVLDEAHRLRNANTTSSQNLRTALGPVRKLLLTATPLQNNLAELHTLTSFIDERTFGDRDSFQLQYSGKDGDWADLRQRLGPLVKRTLRKDVLEYIRYTQRHPLTVTFDPEAPENRLYEEVSEFLQRDDTYALPKRSRHLMVLMLRKILASSSAALAATLEKLRNRLHGALTTGTSPTEEVEEWLEDEVLDEEEAEELAEGEETVEAEYLDPDQLRGEITELDGFIALARSIKVDSKSKALLDGLQKGFAKMQELGGARKALVFTESRRTQAYLKKYLEANGYQGQIVLFNGTNTEPESKAIYEAWRQMNEPLGRTSGNKNIDLRTALMEHFRDHGTIMLATEAAGEGVNLQFCSLVINYDLPWNPQRIEQRIGRCHRYGQKHDVVVVNFLNSNNEADKRVLELLSEKFHLFQGVFGSSDEVLGTLESGVDFERKVLAIYQACRTAQEIDRAFEALQNEMEQQIKARMEKVRQELLEHFDEEVHHRFRNFMSDTQTHLGRIEEMFWRTTKHILDGAARFDDKKREFQLSAPPATGIRAGPYRLITRSTTGQVQDEPDDILYRISHPLGEHVLDKAKAATAPLATVKFKLTGHPTRIMVLEKFKGRSGWMTLTKLSVKSYGEEEHHLFTAFTDSGEPLDQETAEKMFNVTAAVERLDDLPDAARERLSQEAGLAVRAQLAKTLEANTAHFNDEQERLERWASDLMKSAEGELQASKDRVEDTARLTRRATTLQESMELQRKLREAEARLQTHRRRIFEVEDEIRARRDGFIGELRGQLQQEAKTSTLFTIRWSVT